MKDMRKIGWPFVAGLCASILFMLAGLQSYLHGSHRDQHTWNFYWAAGVVVLALPLWLGRRSHARNLR